MEKKGKIELTGCTYCFNFFRSRAVLLIFVFKIFFICYLIFVFKNVLIAEKIGPYPGFSGIPSKTFSSFDGLTLRDFVSLTSSKTTSVFFILSVLMGLESVLFYLDRLEKRYVVFDAMGRHTLRGLLARAYLFIFSYVLVFSLLTGLVVSLPLYLYGLSSRWLEFGLASGLLLFLTWFFLFTVTMIVRDRASAIVIYIFGALFFFVFSNIIHGYANLYNFMAFSAGLVLPDIVLFRLHMSIYPLNLLVILDLIGVLILIWGVYSYEVK